MTNLRWLHLKTTLFNLMGALTFFSFLIPFFLTLIVACRLCVIYVREDNDSDV